MLYGRTSPMRYHAPSSLSPTRKKEAGIVVDDNAKEVKGLIAFYPNVREVKANKLPEYLDRLADDNAPLIATFNECAHEVIWLPLRSEKSSHMEIWPLCHSKKNLITLFVDCSKVLQEKRDKFCIHVLNEFRGTHEFLTKQLEGQGFSFSGRPSYAETRIVVY